jgi:alkylation response protein AidB-like acyl-CoA dehydrogenase
MNLEPTEEQRLLRESVARFCKTEAPIDRVRKFCEDPSSSLDDSTWRKIADQGWIGVLIPEDYGGLNLGATELGIILEEMGRALFPGPYFSTAALGAPAIAMGARSETRSQWLERIASGEVKATLALLEREGGLGPARVRAEASRQGSQWRLSGVKFFVPDLTESDIAVVAARTGAGEEQITLFIVERGAPGVAVEPNRLTDGTARSAQLRLANVEVSLGSVVGEVHGGWEIVRRVLEIANVGIAAQSTAGAEAVLQQAVGYARQRKQFGVPIGSFQAVKHPLANLFAEIESARSAYHYAAWAVDAKSEDMPGAVAVARLTCADAYRHASLVSLQAHGGIGFTWEYDLHLHLKRAMHLQSFLGIPSDYEEIVAKQTLRI